MRSYLTLDRDGRAWKGFDIGDPVNKAKSIWLTDEGIARSERLFREMFTIGREGRTHPQGDGE